MVAMLTCQMLPLIDIYIYIYMVMTLRIAIRHCNDIEHSVILFITC